MISYTGKIFVLYIWQFLNHHLTFLYCTLHPELFISPSMEFNVQAMGASDNYYSLSVSEQTFPGIACFMWSHAYPYSNCQIGIIHLLYSWRK